MEYPMGNGNARLRLCLNGSGVGLRGDAESNPAPAAKSTSTLPPLSSLLGKRRSTPSDAEKAPYPKQMTLPSSYERATSFKAGGERDAQQRDALLYFMMKENLPLSVSRSDGFQYYNSKCTPLWSPPSRQTMTRLMENKYKIAAELVKNALMGLDAVCLTADTWTDSHTTKSYLGTTVHFLLEDSMESACIGVLKLEESHTSVYLAEKLKVTCADWGICRDKVNMAIVDNAENIKLAMKLAFGDDKLLNSFDHTLNLIPKYALGTKSDGDPYVPGVPQLIQKMKDIVTLSHTSSNPANELSRIQIEQFNKTEGTLLRLLQDVKTRWGSTYLMIKRFLEISVVVYQAGKFPELDMLTAAELATLRCIMAILEPFYEATKEMGAEQYTTSSKAIPTVYLIAKAVTNCETPDPLARRFKDFCISEIQRRFGGIEFNKPLAIATMLDPRFVKAYFQSPRAVANAMTHIETEVRAVMRAGSSAVSEAVAAVAQETDTAGPSAVQEQATASSQARASGLWAHHAELVRATNEAVSTDDIPARAKAEIRAYVSRELLPITADPFKSWTAMKPLYPTLFKVARKYLSIIATSLPSERLFSKLSFISTEETSRITAEHLSMRVFLASLEKPMWEAATIPK